MSDRYDEKAKFLGYELQHVRSEEAWDRAVAAFGRECAAEALETASLAIIHAAGNASPDSGTVAGLNVSIVYLEQKAKQIRGKGGSDGK